MGKQTNTSKEWRLLAEDDFSVAEFLSENMNPIPTSIIAFLCQQSIEKYLKGVLTILDINPPFTHDLEELCTLAEKQRPAFVNIFTSCTIITQFAIQPRYDRGLSLSDDDMCLVLSHTKMIKEFLLCNVPELFDT